MPTKLTLVRVLFGSSYDALGVRTNAPFRQTDVLRIVIAPFHVVDVKLDSIYFPPGDHARSKQATFKTFGRFRLPRTARP